MTRPIMRGASRPKSKIAGVAKDEIEEATKWVGGLDRIHRRAAF